MRRWFKFAQRENDVPGYLLKRRLLMEQMCRLSVFLGGRHVAIANLSSLQFSSHIIRALITASKSIRCWQMYNKATRLSSPAWQANQEKRESVINARFSLRVGLCFRQNTSCEIRVPRISSLEETWLPKQRFIIRFQISQTFLAFALMA